MNRASLRRNASIIAFFVIKLFNRWGRLTGLLYSLLQLLLHCVDVFYFNYLIDLTETNCIRIYHLRFDLDHVIEISNREVIGKRVSAFDLPVLCSLIEKRIGPLPVPLVLALRCVLMYLLVYLARVQVRDCYGPILRHTYQMPTLILVDTSGTLIGHEELGDGTAVV